MKVVILTNAYPYYPGEQFIEDEIGYWARHPIARVTVLPAVAVGEPRPLPEGVSIDLGMAGGTPVGRLWFTLRAASCTVFRRELGYLRRSRKMSVYTISRALLHTSKVLQQAQSLQRYAKANGGIDVAYCYWNETQSYAAVLAKSMGHIRKVISRAHGADLYEARRKQAYMPIKRQFIPAYDRLFALSPEGRAYLEATYGAPSGKVEISPLGVPLSAALSQPGAAGSVHVVSVSYCLPVKRLDRIIDALKLFGRQHEQVNIRWTHIGGGPLLDGIRKLAAESLADLRNVSFEFLGEMRNQAIRKYYLDTPVDLFVNTSESEGVPVSIMEAMSAGIPALAPDVGGVASLVSNQCGALLGACPDSEEIAAAISRVALSDERYALRLNARKAIEANFDGARNYTAFVSRVLAI